MKRHTNKIIGWILLLISFAMPFCPLIIQASPATKTLRLLITSDMHGWFTNQILYPNRKPKGLIHIADYIKSVRLQNPDVILLDGGDLVSGSPYSIYYNYLKPHQLASYAFFNLFNDLNYDAVTLGNHDLEVFLNLQDYYIPHSQTVWLAANVTTKDTNLFNPYIILHRQGLNIAVLGITTPGVMMWTDIESNEMITIGEVEDALKKWLPIIRNKENPDIIILLIHDGINPLRDNENAKLNRNPNVNNLRTILGFYSEIDLVITGHDHRLHPYKSNQKLKYISNRPVISGGSHAKSVLDISLILRKEPTKWSIQNSQIKVFRPEHVDHQQRNNSLISADYYSFLSEKLGWKIGSTDVQSATECINQLLSKSYWEKDIKGTLFPLIKKVSIRHYVNKPLRRKHIYQWLPYPNQSVTLTVSRNDLYHLLNPRREFGSYKIPYNRILFDSISKNIMKGFDKERWVNDSDDYLRHIKIKISNYHFNGGGGILSPLFVNKDVPRISKTIFQEQLIAYLKAKPVMASTSCQFLQPYKDTSADSPK